MKEILDEFHMQQSPSSVKSVFHSQTEVASSAELKRSLSVDDNRDRATTLLRSTVRLFTKQRPELEKATHNHRLEHLGERLTQQQILKIKYWLQLCTLICVYFFFLNMNE